MSLTYLNNPLQNFIVALKVLRMKGFPDLPPLWLCLFLAISWGLHMALPLVQISGLVLTGLGVFLAFAGLILIAWSAVWFWRKRTTIEPHHDPKHLIVEGPYRLSRNPIYLGMLAILTGAALWWGTFSGFILPPLYYWVLEKRFIEPEESALRRAFGAQAHGYLNRTRRWL